ncbi:MAG: RHS repeat-associated core domain-containing protein [Candidatus Aureabacteria bacterium]|nr:RHS repeat-associated core domain-containing protein [Candidatus Auribacterota bacterium]
MQGGANCSISYDANGRRIGRSIAGGETVKYVYDGLNIVADLDKAGAVKAIYNTELQLDQMLSCKIDGAKEYYHTDHLGSIRKMSDGNRTVKASYTYEAFGKKKTAPASDQNRYSFTGREDEAEFGLMYYRARYYDPDTGRFISPDPFTRGPDDPRISYRNSWYSAIHGEATLYASWLNPHSFNRYLYCNNNPVGYVDPLGLWEVKIGGSYSGVAVSIAIGNNKERSNIDFAFGLGKGYSLSINPDETTPEGSSEDKAFGRLGLVASSEAEYGSSWIGAETNLYTSDTSIDGEDAIKTVFSIDASAGTNGVPEAFSFGKEWVAEGTLSGSKTEIYSENKDVSRGYGVGAFTMFGGKVGLEW